LKHSGIRGRFFDMLLRFSAEPDRQKRSELEKEIWAEFGVSRAVFVLDMSGFSQLTQRYGVVHYLSLVRRMQVTTEPIIHSYYGKVVKYEADNCFALFPDTSDAIQAAISIILAFDAENIITPPELDIRISCGVDYGDVLFIEGEDFFGNAVNLGSKLGEDLAHPGEILVTSKAMARVPENSSIEYDPVTFNVSGMTIDACSVKFRGEPRES
jgi:adenylate cyclase